MINVNLFLTLNTILHLFHFLLLMKRSLWITLGCLAWKAGPICKHLHQKPQQKTHQGLTRLSVCLLSHSLQQQIPSNIRFGTAYFRVKSNWNTNFLFQFFISILFCITASSLILLSLFYRPFFSSKMTESGDLLVNSQVSQLETHKRPSARRQTNSL